MVPQTIEPLTRSKTCEERRRETEREGKSERGEGGGEEGGREKKKAKHVRKDQRLWNYMRVLLHHCAVQLHPFWWFQGLQGYVLCIGPTHDPSHWGRESRVRILLPLLFVSAVGLEPATPYPKG